MHNTDRSSVDVSNNEPRIDIRKAEFFAGFLAQSIRQKLLCRINQIDNSKNRKE